jgi:GNS1/SUR4 family
MLPFSEEEMKPSLLSPDTLFFLLSSTALFIILWTSLKRHIVHQGLIPAARILINLNSRVCSIFSLCLGLSILYPFLSQSADSSLSELCAYTFHLSKFYEYIDVFLLVAQRIEIAKHMAFHHLTVRFLAF